MNVTQDIQAIGVHDRTIDLFEGQYRVPHGMTYHSYLITDEKIAVMDTADAIITADTPGLFPADVRKLAYRKVRRPIFPLEENTEFEA